MNTTQVATDRFTPTDNHPICEDESNTEPLYIGKHGTSASDERWYLTDPDTNWDYGTLMNTRPTNQGTQQKKRTNSSVRKQKRKQAKKSKRGNRK